MTDHASTTLSLDRDGLQCQMNITVPSDALTLKVNQGIQKLSREITLPGFRQGKVPVALIKQRFGQDVLQQQVSELTESSFKWALERESLDPVATPEIKMDPIDIGQDLSFTASFECYPDVPDFDPKDRKIDSIKGIIDDEDIADALKRIKDSNLQWVETKGAINSKSKAIIDFAGTRDGVAFEGGTAEEYELEMGKKAMIEPFEAALIGMKAGEEKSADMTFPEDYPTKDLAGAPVTFQLSVRRVLKSKPAELNESLFESLGSKAKDLDAFTEELKVVLNEEAASLVAKEQKAIIMDMLDADYSFVLPNTMLDDEKKAIQSSQKSQEDLNDEALEAQAARGVKLSIIMRHLVKQYSIKLDEQKVVAFIQSMALPYMESEMFFNWYVSDQGRVNQARAVVIEQQVVEHIVSIMNTEVKEMNLKSLKGSDA